MLVDAIWLCPQNFCYPQKFISFHVQSQLSFKANHFNRRFVPPLLAFCRNVSRQSVDKKIHLPPRRRWNVWIKKRKRIKQTIRSGTSGAGKSHLEMAWRRSTYESPQNFFPPEMYSALLKKRKRQWLLKAPWNLDSWPANPKECPNPLDANVILSWTWR